MWLRDRNFRLCREIAWIDELVVRDGSAGKGNSGIGAWT
jgi:hypothetical protein